MRKYIKYIFFGLLFYSCNSEINNISFEKTISLDKGELIFKDEYSSRNIVLTDTLLILQTKNKDSLFKVFGSKNLNFLGAFGIKGDGPNDFSYPYTSKQFVVDKDGIKIWMNDLWKYKLSLVNINKSLDSGKTIAEKEFKLNPKYDFTHDLIHYNDTLFYGNHGPDQIGRSRVSKYNIGSDVEVKANLLPVLENTDLINRSNMYALYFDYLAIKPDKTKLVSAMSSFNRIDFYDLNLNHLNAIIETEGNEVKDVKNILHKDGNQLINMRNFYYSLYPTNKYVYALYRKGQPVSDNGKKDINVDVRVFDWDGNPKYLLKMPNDLISISVDEKNNWIYGVDAYNEALYRYKVDLN